VVEGTAKNKTVELLLQNTSHKTVRLRRGCAVATIVNKEIDGNILSTEPTFKSKDDTAFARAPYRASTVERNIIDKKEQEMKVHYPLPQVEDVLMSVAGAKYFSKIDLESGYWQVPMAEEDKHSICYA